MRLIFTVLFEIVIWISLHAGDINFPAGARSSAMATASVSFTDLWSSFNNQAGLAYLKNSSLGFHFENKFMVKEYALQAGAFAVPLRPGTLGLNYRFFGYSKYHETKIGLPFAMKLHRTFALGVQVNYHQTYIAEGYGTYQALTIEMGMVYKPVENLSIGVHAFNPNRVKSNAAFDERIPTVYRAGLNYTILDKATLAVETEKDLERTAVFKGGMEINALKNLDFRLGFGSDYIDYAFGMGYHARWFAFDLAFSHHYLLGFTPHVSVTLFLSSGK